MPKTRRSLGEMPSCKAKEGGWYGFYVSDIIEDFTNIRIQASKKTEPWMEI